MNVISFASHAAAACAGILLWRWRLLWQPKSGLDRVLSAKGSRNVAKEYLNLLLERDVHATLCILSPDMVAAIVGKDDVENIAKTMMKPIVDRTQCLFARQANLWYAHSRWQEEESAQKATIRHFALFAAAAHHVDGFVFHVDTGCETPSIQHHARAVATVVSFLSENDPRGRPSSKSAFLGKHGWVFRFGRTELFISSFSSCYDASSNARGANHLGRYSIIFLQPYHSFLTHEVGDETGYDDTAWDHPHTIRDKIRLRFRDAGLWYPIPRNIRDWSNEAQACIPLGEGEQVVEWWKLSPFPLRNRQTHNVCKQQFKLLFDSENQL